jgi:hypothetical protein
MTMPVTPDTSSDAGAAKADAKRQSNLAATEVQSDARTAEVGGHNVMLDLLASMRAAQARTPNRQVGLAAPLTSADAAVTSTGRP